MMIAFGFQAAGRNAELFSILGLNDTKDKQGPKMLVSPDTIELPCLQKPNWMEEVEVELLGASPPTVGKQATRLTCMPVLGVFINISLYRIKSIYSLHVFLS